ncbi:MAG: hypothetical protein HY940_03645 [Gammaproteobacteria bacterium]|nr:hypothetical protein [Gammaproteobacteria bacterium]
MWRLQNQLLKYVLVGALVCISDAALADDQTPDDVINDIVGEVSATREQPRPWTSKLFHGYIKNETAFRYDEPRSITKLRNILYLEREGQLTEKVRTKISGWYYYDFAYDLFDYQTIAARSVRDANQPLVFIENLGRQRDSNVAEIKELYAEYNSEKLDIRIGKQYVIWGVIDGIRIVDEINPQNFRELILPDLIDYRIPLWTAKLDYYSNSAKWEMLWIPDLRFHKPAPQGSEWELLQEVPNTRYPDPGRLENSELGYRVTWNIFDGEASLSHFITWDDFPVIFRNIAMDSAISPEFYPTFTRINIFGATYLRDIGPGILKAELAYVPDKYFGIANDTDLDGDGYLDYEGELQRRHIRWALGYEFSFKGIDFSPAVTQWIIDNYHPKMIQKQNDTTLTLYMRKPVPEKSMVFQMLIIDLNSLNELYLKPKITIMLSDSFQVGFGLDLFYGEKSSLGVATGAATISGINSLEQSAQFFGNFYNNDRVFAEFKYSF